MSILGRKRAGEICYNICRRIDTKKRSVRRGARGRYRKDVFDRAAVCVSGGAGGLNQRRRRADFAAGVYDGWAELRFCVRQQQVFLHVRNADGDDPLLSKRQDPDSAGAVRDCGKPAVLVSGHARGDCAGRRIHAGIHADRRADGGCDRRAEPRKGRTGARPDAPRLYCLRADRRGNRVLRRLFRPGNRHVSDSAVYVFFRNGHGDRVRDGKAGESREQCRIADYAHCRRLRLLFAGGSGGGLLDGGRMDRLEARAEARRAAGSICDARRARADDDQNRGGARAWKIIPFPND